ncbi:MAG: hypothetical protein FHP92_00005 [Denitromonas halophila]|nr:MAG: hypothetical protein FHP92_00005 [Denitromonas halophila]
MSECGCCRFRRYDDWMQSPWDLLWNNFLSESRIVKFCAQSGWQGEVGFEKEQLATRAKREAIFRAVLAASSAGYASIQARFGPAFQSLNFMLHWVWSQPSNIIPPEEKLRYANIVRSQLSQAELVWLFVGYQLGKVPLESEIVEATGLFWHASLDIYPAIKLILEFGKPSGYDLVELP